MASSSVLGDAQETGQSSSNKDLYFRVELSYNSGFQGFIDFEIGRTNTESSSILMTAFEHQSTPQATPVLDSVSVVLKDRMNPNDLSPKHTINGNTLSAIFKSLLSRHHELPSLYARFQWFQLDADLGEGQYVFLFVVLAAMRLCGILPVPQVEWNLHYRDINRIISILTEVRTGSRLLEVVNEQIRLYNTRNNRNNSNNNARRNDNNNQNVKKTKEDIDIDEDDDDY